MTGRLSARTSGDQRIRSKSVTRPPSKTGETPPATLSEESIAQNLEPFLRPDKRQAGVKMVAMMVQKTYRGPLPTPESFEHYEAVLPGSAERILAMAEKEQNHRHSSEDRVISYEYTARYIGQAGAVVALCLLASLVAYCATIGEPVAAALIGAISAIVIGFLRYSQTRFENLPETTDRKPAKSVGSKRRSK